MEYAVTPRTMVFFRGFIPAIIDFVKEVKESSKTVATEIKVEKKNLEKACDELGDKDLEVSDRLNSEIIRLSSNSNISRTFYLAGAKETAKWINYAIYYITNEDAELISTSTTNKELVNGIGELIGYGIIYDGYNCADLHKYNASELEIGYKGDHLLMIDDISDKIRNEDFMDKVKAVKNKRVTGLDNITTEPNNSNNISSPVCSINAARPVYDNVIGYKGDDPIVLRFGTKHRVDKEGLYHPILFDDYTKVSDQPFNDGSVTQEEIDFFEKELKTLIPDYHFYRKDTNGNITVTCVRSRNGISIGETYILDNGKIMGGNNKPYVMANYYVNNNPYFTFVDIEKHRDMARHIFENKFNYLDIDTVASLYPEKFEELGVYRNIDFSNTPWMNNISKINFYSLGKRLKGVYKIMHESDRKDFRLRFKEYTSPFKFTLVSDSNVVSPLAALGITSNNIENGTTYEVDDLNVKITYNNGTIRNVELVPNSGVA